MDIGTLARRDAIAQARIMAAAKSLATIFNLPPEMITALDSQRAKDPRTAAMQQREFIADLLEVVAAAQAHAAPEPVAQAPAAQMPVAQEPAAPTKKHKA
jgi:hypothetical protein